ncbi:MAG TPA: aminomethyltransferase family protein [Longimicrobiaceae bacterium]|nr:aminomethyltransferase family protein [Longimicrobiaceae bacterium]
MEDHLPNDYGKDAVFGEVAGVTIARHFGDSAEEYRAVRESAGIADRGDLAVLRLWGRDPVKMMQGLITNDLAGAGPGRGVYAAMLTPKGRMIAELRAFVRDGPDGAEVIILMPREALAGTVEHFKKFIPPMFAKWADVSDSFGTIGAYGPNARQLLESVLGPIDLANEDDFVTHDLNGAPVLAVRTHYAGGEEGYDVVLPKDEVDDFRSELLQAGAAVGARPVGFGALETLRVEAGVPRYGSELTEETIPTEAYESIGMLPRAISFTKGCYTGQEVIIRIAHRGHVNRHLRGIALGDGPVPPPRTPLFNPDNSKQIGWTTTAVFSPELGESIALAFLRREFEPGQTVKLGDADGPAIEVRELPFRK